MDVTRSRRTRDTARPRWYGLCRMPRFARLLGFLTEAVKREPCTIRWQPIRALAKETRTVAV
jgi:hypothetical protein